MRNSKGMIIFFLGVLFCISGLCHAQGEFNYPKDLERDPFEPLINSQGVINARLVKRLGDLEINGIIYSEDKKARIVIINDVLLKESDYIGSYKIEEIRPGKVILNKMGEKVVLQMKGE